MCSLYCDWNYSLLKPTKPDLHFTAQDLFQNRGLNAYIMHKTLLNFVVLLSHGGRNYSGGSLTLHQLYSLGGLRLLRLAEFVRYNRAAIGGPSKRQPMNSLVASCLGPTCYAQTPFARYWQAIKAAANEITPKVGV